MATDQQHRWRVIVAFATVYLLWGSTYLAMRVAVRDIAPYVLGSVRYLIAGPIMLAACALLGKKVKLTRQDFWRLLAISVLLLTTGNMGVAWSEIYVPSGLAALMVAAVPIWVAVAETWVFKSRRLAPRGLFGLGMGIAGAFVLLWPKLVSGTHLGHMELLGMGILAIGSGAWALGSVLSGRWDLSVGVFTATAWEMTLGGLVNTVIAIATGGFRTAHWTSGALWSTGYLVVCGSWLGFTAYIWLLEHVPTTKVATYAYVNPIVAVFLGWLLLSEKVDGFMAVGTAIIISAVALVNTSKFVVKPSVQGRGEMHSAVITTLDVAGD